MKQTSPNRHVMGKAAAYVALGFSPSSVGDVVASETGMDKVAIWKAIGSGLLTAGKFLAKKGIGAAASAAASGAKSPGIGSKLLSWGTRGLRGLGANLQRAGRGMQHRPYQTMGKGVLNFGKSISGMGTPGTGLGASAGRGVNNLMTANMTMNMAGSMLPRGGGARPPAPKMPKTNISPYA